jgi:hypothetical protein
MDILPVGLLMQSVYKNQLVHVTQVHGNFRAFGI